MIYFESKSLGWKCFMDSWLNSLPDLVQKSRKPIETFLMFILDPCLDFVHLKCKVSICFCFALTYLSYLCIFMYHYVLCIFLIIFLVFWASFIYSNLMSDCVMAHLNGKNIFLNMWKVEREIKNHTLLYIYIAWISRNHSDCACSFLFQCHCLTCLQCLSIFG